MKAPTPVDAAVNGAEVELDRLAAEVEALRSEVRALRSDLKGYAESADRAMDRVERAWADAFPGRVTERGDQ